MRVIRGIHVPHRKNTSELVPERMPVPSYICVPVSMHIGAPAKPVVKPGDSVKVGQLIAEANGFVSSPIHASVSGKVKKIDLLLCPNGQYTDSIIIESDGMQEVSEDIQPPAVTDMQSFLEAVRNSGVVGLGGAGFPTAVKLSVKDLNKVETIVINGAECEPYITSDTRTMIDDAEFVWKGIALLQKYFGNKRVIIGIERNKPACIRAFQERCKDTQNVEVCPLPASYPQGGEKVLIYNTTGRIVPEGKLPLDAGAIVVNCTTVAAIAHYIETGMPLVEKCVTVDGSAVKNPKNVIVPIGTPLQAVFDFCGGFEKEPRKVLYGGPMMGIAVTNLDVPVLKNTNALLAFDEKDAMPPAETSCIKCGRCISACSLNLMPAEIERAYKLGRPEELEKLKVNICMECGSCSFVCPAKHSLVQVNKLAKAMLRKYQDAKKAAAEKEIEKEKENKPKEEVAVK